MIVNKDQILFIDRLNDGYVKRYLPYNDPLQLSYTRCHKDSQFYDKDCFMISVVTPLAIKEIYLQDILSSEQYQALMDKKLIIIIEQTTGAIYNLVDSIYEHLIILQNVPPSQILLVCGSMDNKIRIDEQASKHNTDRINIEVYYRYEKENLQRFYLDWNIEIKDDSPYPKIENPFIKRDFNKKFLCFNGMYRTHRLALLTLLHNKNLQEQGFLSFAKFPRQEIWKDTYNRALEDYPSIKDEIIAGSDVQEKLPYILDIKNFYQDLGIIVRSSMSYYRKSYFSIITETFYKNIYPRFITEKIIKGFMFKHPFIAVSSPGTLEILKDMGYKTFNTIIDESYDKINDDGLRLKAIAIETERLCNLSTTELSDFCDKAYDITEYNYNVLSTKTTYIKSISDK